MINPELISTIRSLKKASRKQGIQLWKALADELDKAKRRRVALNLSRINRHTEAGDVVAVPGKVLGAGNLTHPVTVAAFSFSNTAREKIDFAEGRAITLMELLAESKNPSEIRILK